MKVTLNGVQYDIDREAVEKGLAGAAPDPIRELRADIAGAWWPPKQAVVAGLHQRQPEKAKANGIRNTSMNSTWATGVLRRLKYRVYDLKDGGPFPELTSGPSGSGSTTGATTGGPDRALALTLGVELMKGTLGASAGAAIAAAEEFEAFLSSSQT